MGPVIRYKIGAHDIEEQVVSPGVDVHEMLKQPLAGNRHDEANQARVHSDNTADPGVGAVDPFEVALRDGVDECRPEWLRKQDDDRPSKGQAPAYDPKEVGLLGSAQMGKHVCATVQFNQAPQLYDPECQANIQQHSVEAA